MSNYYEAIELVKPKEFNSAEEMEEFIRSQFPQTYEFQKTLNNSIEQPNITNGYPDMCYTFKTKVFDIKETCNKFNFKREWFSDNDIDFFDEDEYCDWGWDYTIECEQIELSNELNSDEHDWIKEDYKYNRESCINNTKPLKCIIQKEDIVIREVDIHFFMYKYFNDVWEYKNLFKKFNDDFDIQELYKGITDKEKLYNLIEKYADENYYPYNDNRNSIDFLMDLYDNWKDNVAFVWW